jgi:hypothetical protein
MPRRRPDKKGSFGGHFDELVRVFEPEPRSRPDSGGKPQMPAADDASVHDRLFESAWRAAREKDEARP